MRQASVRGLAAVVVATLCAAVPAVAVASFDDPADHETSQQREPPPAANNVQRRDMPNDPDYDQAEPDNEPDTGTPSTSMFDERFDLFGFPSSKSATTAKYHDTGDPLHQRPLESPQISGFNAAGAWKATRGSPDVSVAILDTGINWDNCGLRDKVRLSRAELAGDNRPQTADGTYDESAGTRRP